MDEQELLRRLREAFQVESTERMTTITTRLVDLENAEPDKRQTILEDIYREAHSLKGASRSVNLFDIEDVCQALESVFGGLKSGGLELSTELFDLFHETVSNIEDLLVLDGGEAPAETAIIISRLQAMQSGDSWLNDAVSSPSSAGFPDNISNVSEYPPIVEECFESEEDFPPAVLDTEVKTPEPEVEPAPGPSEKENKSAPVQESRPEKNLKNNTVRIGAEKLDSLLRKAEEMISLKLVAEEQYQSILQGKAVWARLQELVSSGAQQKDTIERFVAMNQDAFSDQTLGMEALLKTAEQNRRLVGKMVDDLLDDMKSITMLPFTTLTDIFPRMVRDIARQQDKDVELKMTGTDIEIDRRILEEMKDPLVHLVRNAIDHGIESKKERAARNKPAKAQLKLDIQQREGGKVEVRLSDDGKGMDPEKLKQSALSKGLITSHDAEGLDADQCFDLIFLSGMTTSSIITEISGRGLGMAIVQENVEQLGGSINLHSEVHIGTTFTIQLPVSLATFRGVLLSINSRKFLISSNLVDTVIRVKPSEVNTIENKTTIPFQNKTLPIVDLAAILNLSSPGKSREEKDLKVIVLGSGEKRIGFKVDEVIQEQEILVKGLGKQLVRVRHIAGATILGSGEIVPVLNVRDLIATASQSNNAIPLAGIKDGSEGRAQKSVLVAEDSITSRMLLRSILEGAGYKVTTAVDGLDALTSLKKMSVDLVVSDVEMPRMNGFELSSQIRQDERLKETPIVLCTSLASPEDKERGVEAGATAYIVKSDFDQSGLLKVVGRLI